jgi:hypothetical protein
VQHDVRSVTPACVTTGQMPWPVTLEAMQEDLRSGNREIRW